VTDDSSAQRAARPCAVLREHAAARGLAPTPSSYRDAFALLLRFLAARALNVVDLDVMGIDPAV
jgi:hypothetical protein